MIVSTKDFAKEFRLLFQAKATLIMINTLEEVRAMAVAKQICDKFSFPCVSYDIADGFKVLSGDKTGQPQGAHDPLSALNQIETCKGKGLYILKDFHTCWNDAVVRRKLRNLAEKLKGTDRSIVVITPVHEVPIELQDDSAIIDLPLPKASDLDSELEDVARRAEFTIDLDKLSRKKLLESGQGLTANQARRAFLKAAVSGNGALNESQIEFISKAKQDAIRESQALEYYEVEETIEDVGGLENVKLWLKEREKNFSNDALEYGLDVPKGIVLIGIPGTGKSLTAKTISSLWRMPLLRLDAGALFGKYVGESEENTRKALQLAGTLAPCVLWIDEVEKAFATGGDLDGGTHTRVVGQLLTWMQEKKEPVFVVATANNVEAVPPELFRRGRFDETFFMDLPGPVERKDIFRVLLKKRGRDPKKFDLAKLAETSDGFTGAELEQAIKDAMVKAYYDNGREVNTEDILAKLSGSIPLSKSHRKKIEALREWLKDGRAQSASFKDADKAIDNAGGIKILLDE